MESLREKDVNLVLRIEQDLYYTSPGVLFQYYVLYIVCSKY
jgi:hypothetical protein